MIKIESRPRGFGRALINEIKAGNRDDISTLIETMPKGWGFLYSDENWFWSVVRECATDGDLLQIKCRNDQHNDILKTYKDKLFDTEKRGFRSVKLIINKAEVDLGTLKSISSFKDGAYGWIVILVF